MPLNPWPEQPDGGRTERLRVPSHRGAPRCRHIACRSGRTELLALSQRALTTRVANTTVETTGRTPIHAGDAPPPRGLGQVRVPPSPGKEPPAPGAGRRQGSAPPRASGCGVVAAARRGRTPSPPLAHHPDAFSRSLARRRRPGKGPPGPDSPARADP